MAVQLPGWHSPVVPRPAADGQPDDVPLPSELLGDSAATYYNMAARNDMPTLAEDVRWKLLLDDAIELNMNFPYFFPEKLYPRNTESQAVGVGHNWGQVLQYDISFPSAIGTHAAVCYPPCYVRTQTATRGDAAAASRRRGKQRHTRRQRP